MANSNITLWRGQERSSWIRLRTLILLRWVAIIGQITAITVAQQTYHVELDVMLCYLAIGVSILGNLTAILIFPRNKRLSEFENFLMVLFDLLQLTVLLYLTGGLNNPFALLLVGPVTISANVMSTRSTLIVGVVAIVLTTLLAEFHVPLRTDVGMDLEIPDILLFGNWAAIVIAIVFLGAYSHRVSSEVQSMSEALAATHMALAREQKLTDLGGVVAAAAHELGTPLATIKLTSSELIEELDDRPELKEDAALIREQANRCRDILRDMGRAGKDDLHLRQAPLSTVVNEAAEPHIHRGKTVHFTEGPADDGDVQQPSILRKPEIIHGLRNLIQNAVDFARANVWVEAEWSSDQIIVSIMDDGRGYPSQMIGRIGDPFMRRRRAETDQRARPEYEGMGLGLFIAKTLLERSGAELDFANGSDPYQTLSENPERRGAIVKVTWPRNLVDAQQGDTPVPSGANQRIQV
ncbi:MULTISPECIES: sensor histidine kinase RegB [unclassified Ruegeria]|uniref:sensor histidine kinase RegB n=1 Tax=unclassified Ruegeria TaxID=2625375 RepID=UPI001ADBEAEC|nr:MULTISPECIES: ActS/PrrB/RegB family redox-sensitive histidine kinase [unclassified Ruegeria]MBO9412240.1 ActS/PrrB/RegB family redox-sensitive histidine kinase [Ruegeria sp. R8_1]MBO9417454.1 ActS/PrrB/RegB family redox-sensitive histidine kinase [Ruegeria sp. R8_2]